MRAWCIRVSENETKRNRFSFSVIRLKMLRTKLGSFYGNFVNPRENRIAETVCQQFRFWLKDEADERLAKNRNERAILFFLFPTLIR